MPLYVTRPDPPAPGFDFVAVVPGQYLWDITAITATLTTQGSPDLPTNKASNGLDGFYDDGGSPLQFFPGALTGDDALDVLDATVLGNTQQGWENRGFEIPLTGSFSIVWWYYPSPFVPGEMKMIATDDLGNGVGSFYSTNVAGRRIQFFFGTCEATSFALPALTNGVWHQIGVDYDDGTGFASIYLDGVALPLDIGTAGGPVFGPVDRIDFGNSGGFSPTSTGGIDEFAYFDTVIGPAGHNALFAAAPDFDAYTVACLALAPRIYYHLDGVPTPGGDRQVVFQVTDGSYIVEEIPTGFAEIATAAPLTYSWQPNLRSSTETQGGANTAVAIGRLLLPAGYTVGTDTLDMSPGDQWSDIAIWWDSTLMDSLNTEYEYPPGQHLVYVQDPNAPYE